MSSMFMRLVKGMMVVGFVVSVPSAFCMLDPRDAVPVEAELDGGDAWQVDENEQVDFLDLFSDSDIPTTAPELLLAHMETYVNWMTYDFSFIASCRDGDDESLEQNAYEMFLHVFACFKSLPHSDVAVKKRGLAQLLKAHQACSLLLPDGPD